MNKEKTITIRKLVSEWNGKWDKNLWTGVVFYYGERITV